MSVGSNHTAILIFSRTARHEAAVKTFSTRTGRSGNRAIAQRLIGRTIATARRSGLPVFIHYTAHADRRSFGERLADALESVFTRGFERVIAIGNDSPDLSAAHLLAAACGLERQPLVLGPAKDGGVYLIGMHRQAYHRAAFVALPWTSARLQEGWHGYSASPAVWLAPLVDLDDPDTFAQWLDGSSPGDALRRQLRRILAGSLPVRMAPIRTYFRPDIHPRVLLRGPPC